MGMKSMAPILLDIPESFASERLLIRAPLCGDGALVNAAVRESLPELRAWMPWAQSEPTVEESEASIRRARVKFLERSDMRLLLVHRETGELVGSSGLHRMDWTTRKFEIGYWLHSRFTGQGYMTEAVHAIADFAVRQLQANRIEIRCDSRNVCSAKVAERCGFTLEGVLRRDCCDVNGMLRDTMVFAKVRGMEF